VSCSFYSPDGAARRCGAVTHTATPLRSLQPVTKMRSRQNINDGVCRIFASWIFVGTAVSKNDKSLPRNFGGIW